MKEKKDKPVLEGTAIDGTQKLSADYQPTLIQKEPGIKEEPASLEHKLLIMEKQKYLRRKSKAISETVAHLKPKQRTLKSDQTVTATTETASPKKRASSKKTSMYSFVANISAYTASADEGTAGGRTASGRIATEGRTLAASRHLPLGTKVRIEGLPGTYVVEDRGGAISGNNIDLFVGSKTEASKWGRQNRKVYISEWGSGKVD
ncbi:3D domain-containing protein [Aneurinibacillus sp. Ricciae_BoGa-3]|uniref:3D domain-containing protein n=1 Tax=Aneurinibacillus sp. Ricciae_BoGa-3 TaxID=3022697 RepID=UPI00234210EF|nr:3D domain-containing protein [Aneurinibacillus sp. Ricciae_BoGa-3]WCK54945.1 3D domain-containing protein [Aneurinibacillus sp. Ricciae_BoGa-3]